MSETSLKNSLHNLDYELYSEDYSMNQLWQFGSKLEEEINAEIEENVSNNTKKTHESIWKQFSTLHSFVKNYRWDH
jgi:predicted hydrolase (HD superfamily)